MTDAPAGPVHGEHRLFFALWPDDVVRGALAAAVDAVADVDTGARRVAPGKYHVTLHFLGGGPEFAADVADAARAAAHAVEASAFHLVIDHAGAFARSRVGWLAPAGNSGLDALWSALGHALDAAGVERRAAEAYVPHVTVLRGLRGALPETPVGPISWPVDRFVLVHSHAGRYDIIGEWALARA